MRFFLNFLIIIANLIFEKFFIIIPFIELPHSKECGR